MKKIQINKLYNIDCEEGIDLMIEQGLKVDCIITSPPYNLGMDYDYYEDRKPYNEYIVWLQTIFHRCQRILNDGATVCINIGDQKNGSIPTHSNIIQFMLRDGLMNYHLLSTIIWDKGHTSKRTAWGSYLSPSCPSFPAIHEYILIFRYKNKKHKGNPLDVTVTKDEFIKNAISIWKVLPEKSQNGHPAMFPAEIPYRLIQQLTYKNDIVLDLFSGVGTTCKVAKENGRRFIGFELSEKYHKLATKRIVKFFE